MTVLIGTSGYSYEDWVGPYYPPELNKEDWLTYYSHDFNTTELNFTYYRMPNPWQMERISLKTPPDFKFSVKAFRGMTHEKEAAAPELIAEFCRALQPMIEQNKFACALIQFPWSFQCSARNQAYLGYLKEQMADVPAVVEFRHISWINETTFEKLRQLPLGFCCLDEPPLKGLIPSIARVTSPVAYVRFHGRNSEKWWNHAEAWERYDYSYSDEELNEWVPKIQILEKDADMVVIYANNHWRSQAVTTAIRLADLLKSASLAEED